MEQLTVSDSYSRRLLVATDVLFFLWLEKSEK